MALHDYLDVIEDALLQEAANIRRGNVATYSSPERIAMTKYQIDAALRCVEEERKVKRPNDVTILLFWVVSLLIFIFIGIALGVLLAYQGTGG